MFKVEPHELVAGTAYPRAKAERLPVVVARHTEVEHQLALLDNDLALARDLGGAGCARRGRADDWQSRLRLLGDVTHDRHERALLADAQARLTTSLDALL